MTTGQTSRGRCTPGFNAGPVRPGRWLIEVDTYRLLPPDPITYTIDVTLSNRPIAMPPRNFPKPKRALRGPGWYKGDLHAHSLHSDASWDIPDLIAYAKSCGHDFQSLTDHNTVSGLPEHESRGDDELMMMGGLELTTYYGHAVVLGTRQWQEWRLDTPEHFTMPQIAQKAMDSGGFFIIAHPRNVGYPECAGCHWEFDDMRPGNARTVEIWNGTWNPCTEHATQDFYQWLTDGYRMVATGGTDLHGPPAEPRRHGTTVIYANELSEAEIVAALRKGTHLRRPRTADRQHGLGSPRHVRRQPAPEMRWSPSPGRTRIRATGSVSSSTARCATSAMRRSRARRTGRCRKAAPTGAAPRFAIATAACGQCRTRFISTDVNRL